MRRMLNKKIICKDGFTMSVQANEMAYCTPRRDQPPWTKVEVGYPSEAEPLLLEYADDPRRPTETVYGYVPTSVIYLVVTKHGGMVSGEMPEGVYYYDGRGDTSK